MYYKLNLMVDRVYCYCQHCEHTHLFIELKVCERELDGLSNLLLLDVHPPDISIHDIRLLICTYRDLKGELTVIKLTLYTSIHFLVWVAFSIGVFGT